MASLPMPISKYVTAEAFDKPHPLWLFRNLPQC